jgi:DNA-binding NarL/FixJ family response regulator
MTSAIEGFATPCLDVLVVDDLAETRRLLRMILDGDDRFRVVGEAADGVEGIEQATLLHPDLIVLDLVMPRLTGLDALPQLRLVAPGAKVVVVSSSQDQTLENEARSLGAVGYLEKGLPPTELIEGLLAMAGALDSIAAGLAEVRSRLAPEVKSAGSARRFVEAALADWEAPAPADVVKLLVSELVTNAVLHAKSEAEVVVQLRPRCIRVEVLDRSHQLPVIKDVEPEATSGRGMALVSSYASAWGTRRLPHGKAVWFEVPRSAPAS